jgi:transcription initiation factor TFIID TATA-box-binding protein
MRKRKYSSLPSGQFSSQSAGDYDNIPLPTVHNIVATSQIAFTSLDSLDLNRIHEMLPFSFYDQHKFAAITVRLHQPDCTTLLFSSGKLVVTGCRTWYECVYASLFVASILEECIPGHSFSLCACDVQNMVAHVEIPVHGGCLDLHGMYARMALNCTYQRKMFPGLIYRPEASPVVLLCFFSGKIVITGGKTMEDMFTGWKRLWPTLKSFVIPRAQAMLSSLPVFDNQQHKRSKPGAAHALSHKYTQPMDDIIHRVMENQIQLEWDPTSDEQPNHLIQKDHGQPTGTTLDKPESTDGREEDQSLAFGWNTVAGYPGGNPNTLKESARGHCSGGQMFDFTDSSKLKSLCYDLATESHPLMLGRGFTGCTTQEGWEPRSPHASIVKTQIESASGAAVFQTRVVLS